MGAPPLAPHTPVDSTTHSQKPGVDRAIVVVVTSPPAGWLKFSEVVIVIVGFFIVAIVGKQPVVNVLAVQVGIVVHTHHPRLHLSRFGARRIRLETTVILI